MNIAWRIYRLLARAFPQEFKMAYGAEVMQLGEDVVGDIAKRHWRHWADTPDRGHCGSGSARNGSLSFGSCRQRRMLNVW